MTPRIASLFPAATEVVAGLGAISDLVGVSHACDYPPEVRGLPRLTRSRIPGDGADCDVDLAVRALMETGEELYQVDVDELRRVAPDTLLVQELCQVCAISPAGARAALEEAELEARVVALRADSLAGVARDMIDVGETIGRSEQGHACAREFEARLAEVFARTADLSRPRVASLEWLDPPFAAGHWVPQMVRLAGGEEVLGKDAERSRQVDWEEVIACLPRVLCVMPCGYDLSAAHLSWEAVRARLLAERSPLVELDVVLLDARALFSRPGPRLARGVEVLAALLHPEAGLPAPYAEEGARP